MFLSGSRSATAIRSLIWWIVAFGGPNSITCGQKVAMKRPSEVPPVVDSSGRTPVTCSIAALIAADSAPRGVRNGAAPSVQSIVEIDADDAAAAVSDALLQRCAPSMPARSGS